MLVYTIKELCRTCYTCVRECPAKAIRIVGGQAEVITERCIACGNCTKVCSQGAKVFLKTTDRVLKLLADEPKVAAMLAPSFPAEFYDISDYRSLIGMIRSIGFKYIAEVSFGADLVADRYKKLVTESREYFISSDCPSIVNYIKFYHPALAEQAGRCKKIVAGLLNFARKNQVNHQLVSVKELINHSLESVIVPDNIKVQVVDQTSNPEAMLDSEQMIQVLTNLVKNGIDAMPGGGEIRVLLEDTLSDVSISIGDTGTGIKEEDRVKIFEPFFTTKGLGHGTGLGLATAYGIVKMHKGQITVESNTDPQKGETGTSFKIVLPRRKE